MLPINTPSALGHSRAPLLAESASITSVGARGLMQLAKLKTKSCFRALVRSAS